MLIIARKKGERLLIDGPCEIVVHRVQSKQCALGVIAPKNVHVLRAELQGLPNAKTANGTRDASTRQEDSQGARRRNDIQRRAAN